MTSRSTTDPRGSLARWSRAFTAERRRALAMGKTTANEILAEIDLRRRLRQEKAKATETADAATASTTFVWQQSADLRQQFAQYRRRYKGETAGAEPKFATGFLD